MQWFKYGSNTESNIKKPCLIYKLMIINDIFCLIQEQYKI